VVSLTVNDRAHQLDVDPSTPLLWVLREQLGLTGAKYGCGIATCGACLVHVEGKPVNSCVTPVSVVAGKRIITIEGLSADHNHVVQRAWVAEDVPQCGFCQSGQIMAAVALLAHKPNPTDAEIDEAMVGVVCRCGTYNRVRRAIKRAAALAGKGA
jgi:isoquinoline 1-oxidoreductase subunit alpha